jgi:protein-tyrosine phosphatase
MKILMVCLGNICRSPLAEGIMQKKVMEAGLNWTIDSTGTNGFHVGEAPHQLSQKVAKLNGIDISRQIASRFTNEDLEKYDIIYAMAADVLSEMKQLADAGKIAAKTSLFLEELYPGRQMDVPDPWYGDEDGYHEVYTLIEKACDTIIEKYLVNNNPATKHNV